MIVNPELEPRGVITDNDVQTIQRRDLVLRLRSQGCSLPQIAKECGISLSLVQFDLRVIRADFLKIVARNSATWMSEVIGQLDTIIRVGWEDYLQSDKPAKETMVETSEKGTKSRRSRKTRKRDPRYLAIVKDAIKDKASILGLGDKASVDRIDETLGKRRPKLLVVRDRSQVQDLVDVTKLLELEFQKPSSPGQEDNDGVIDGQVIDGGPVELGDARFPARGVRGVGNPNTIRYPEQAAEQAADDSTSETQVVVSPYSSSENPP